MHQQCQFPRYKELKTHGRVSAKHNETTCLLLKYLYIHKVGESEPIVIPNMLMNA
jgi:hypothetical protein